MCEKCKIPVCRSCGIKLSQAKGKSNVPMSLANDNWYPVVANNSMPYIESKAKYATIN